MEESLEFLGWRNQSGFARLHAAAYLGDVERVIECLRLGDDPNVLDANGETALYWACFKSKCSAQYVDVVRVLLTAGASVGLRPPEGNPPLLTACEAGCPEVIAALLEAGAKPNEYFDHRPPIVAAAQSGCAEGVSLLLAAGADPNAVGEFRLTAREWAESNGFNAVISVFDAFADTDEDD